MRTSYKYAHDYEDHFVEGDFLPEEIKDNIYYEPTDKGREANLKKYLDARWKRTTREKEMIGEISFFSV